MKFDSDFAWGVFSAFAVVLMLVAAVVVMLWPYIHHTNSGM